MTGLLKPKLCELKNKIATKYAVYVSHGIANPIALFVFARNVFWETQEKLGGGGA